MMSSITKDAPTKITRFNNQGLHYNLVADEIYKVHSQIVNPFDKSYLRYVIAGLVSFDMKRWMGVNEYSFDKGNFGERLNKKLQMVRKSLEPLLSIDLVSIDLHGYSEEIGIGYEELSKKGHGSLHQDQQKSFSVGASKVLHFLNPKLFIVIDSNAARAFKNAHAVPFKNGTQPKYSSELYIECMNLAKRDILNYGLDDFKALEPNTPITRIYDKLTFVTGSE